MQMAAKISTSAKAFPLLAFISAVVFVSGCTTTPIGNTGSGMGIAILNFDSDFDNVQSSDDVTLRVQLQNQGAVTAQNVEAEIINIDLDEWTSGFFQGERKRLGDLLAADPVSNTEGQQAQAEWYLQAPLYPRNIQFTHTPTVRVFYDYKTIAQKPITVVTEDELRRMRDSGRTLPGGATQSSGAPISADIRTGDFIKTDTGSFDYPFSLNIMIRNNGPGDVIKGSRFAGGFVFDDFDYPVRVKITMPKGMTLVSSGPGCSTAGEWINLFRGRENTVTCQASIVTPPAYVSQEMIQVELEYRYYIDQFTNVNVVGTQDGWDYF